MRLIFSFFLIAFTQIQSMGTQMLNLPSSADEVSIGSHPTLKGLLPINPALYVASEKHPYLYLNKGNWFGDVTLSQIGYNIPGLDKVIHLGLRYSGLSDLEFREDRPQDDPFANFSAYGLILDAGIAFQRFNRSFGISLSYVQFGLYTEESRGASIDIGYSLKMKNGYSIGIVAKNFGMMTKLENDTPTLPTRFSSGISKDLQFKNFRNSVFGSLEWNSIISGSKVYLGNRFSWNRLNMLAGYSMSKKVTESSFGIGINMNRYQITYGTKFGTQNIGFPKLLSIKVSMP
jgi:hypothetical protein